MLKPSPSYQQITTIFSGLEGWTSAHEICNIIMNDYYSNTKITNQDLLDTLEIGSEILDGEGNEFGSTHINAEIERLKREVF